VTPGKERGRRANTTNFSIPVKRGREREKALGGLSRKTVTAIMRFRSLRGGYA
jgi:hypothetical protein